MAEISSVVKKYVSKNNVSIVRSSLVRELKFMDLDSLNTFIESLRYSEEKMADLYELDDGEVLSNEISETNYEDLINKLMNNFSENKCKTVIKIGKSLFGDDDNTFKKKEGDDGEIQEVLLSNTKQKKTIVLVVASIIILILLTLKILK